MRLKTPDDPVSSIVRWPRTARSMSVADTSIGLATSSMIVPTMPGCTPGGGWNWTATVGRPPRTVAAAASGVPSPLAPVPIAGERPGVRSA